MRKADLVDYILLISEVSTVLTVDQVLDTVQDLPDDVWDYIRQKTKLVERILSTLGRPHG